MVTKRVDAEVQAEVSKLEDFQLDDIIALGAPTGVEKEILYRFCLTRL